MRRLKAGLIAVGALVLAATAAQSADKSANEIFLIADRVTVEGKRDDHGGAATAAALKTDTPLVDIPQALTVITEDLIKGQSMRSLADALRYVPGATMAQGEGHRDAPTLRGNATTADFFVDGVRDDVQYFRDLYNVSRLEVIKGPNALIFGRGGGGGVVNRVTKQADFEPAEEARLEAGQFGYGRATADFGGTVSPGVAARAVAVYENADSYRDFVGIERYGVNLLARYAVSDAFTPYTSMALGLELGSLALVLALWRRASPEAA